METLPDHIKGLILEFAQDVYVYLNYDILTLSYNPPSIHTKIKYPDILYSPICSPIMRPDAGDSIYPDYKPHKINFSDYLDEPIGMFYDDDIYCPIDISIGRLSCNAMLINQRLELHSQEYIDSFESTNIINMRMIETTIRDLIKIDAEYDNSDVILNHDKHDLVYKINISVDAKEEFIHHFEQVIVNGKKYGRTTSYEIYFNHVDTCPKYYVDNECYECTLRLNHDHNEYNEYNKLKQMNINEIHTYIMAHDIQRNKIRKRIEELEKSKLLRV